MAAILIIDDEPAIRGILRLQLEKAGHQVLEAVDGQDGLEQAQSKPVDLIFLDVMIPKMDGWHLCKEVKGHPKTKHIPVVMLTSCTQKIEELRAWESGADEFLAKPWMPAQVTDVLSRLLTSQRKSA